MHIAAIRVSFAFNFDDPTSRSRLGCSITILLFQHCISGCEAGGISHPLFNPMLSTGRQLATAYRLPVGLPQVTRPRSTGSPSPIHFHIFIYSNSFQNILDKQRFLLHFWSSYPPSTLDKYSISRLSPNKVYTSSILYHQHSFEVHLEFLQGLLVETRVVAMAPQTSEQMLRSWYAKLWAPTVDLIGDIAGKEPFIIHGESLIRHCLEESPADFQGMIKRYPQCLS